MSSTTLTRRAAAEPEDPRRSSALDRVLGHPAAFVATAAILLALFGGTFIVNPDRVAPTKDPAYYTWKTEALMTETPATVLEIKGPFDFFSSGYRVVAPVTGALLRHIPGVSELHSTAVLMVMLPVGTALLLAAFAYRQRRDPLLWHSVAFFSASLFLTPPFVGYLDNVFCLFFLAASLLFIGATRNSWPARIAFGLFLLGAGLTHPTTLVIFGLVLGIMTAVRLVWRKFDFRSVVRDDGPLLGAALAAAVATFLIWKIGIWGPPAPLGDAALAPPYTSAFFVDRLVLWVKAMRPFPLVAPGGILNNLTALNGPLLIVGAVGLLAAWKRWVEDDLSRLSILWLAPLAGIFGFLAGKSYPYYRFFNTTLAWVLLVGVGAYFVARWLIDRSRAGGMAWLALLGVFLLAAVIAMNFKSGFELTAWNKASGGWLNDQTRTDLTVLHSYLESLGDQDRPVIFVIDQEDHSPQVYGYTKLSGNTSRYGLPDEQIDRGHLFLGALEDFVRGRPTSTGEDIYDELSAETLREAREGIEQSRQSPIVVVASIFNTTGANAEIATGEGASAGFADGDVWALHDGAITDLATGERLEVVQTLVAETGPPGALHIVRVVLAFALLLLPGLLAYRRFLPGGGLPEALGLVPALAVVLLSFAGIALLAALRSPYSFTLALVTVAIALALGAFLFLTAPAAERSAGRVVA
jgi:hypothetical protein